MVLIGDADYINGGPAKLENNRYNKRDSTFSGSVTYFTADGKFVNSWRYKNGKINKAHRPILAVIARCRE